MLFGYLISGSFKITRRSIRVKSNELIDTNEATLSIPGANREWQKGVTTVEYAVLLVLIAIAVMVADPNLSSSIVGVFSDISSRLAG